jgi:hypothetical protein
MMTAICIRHLKDKSLKGHTLDDQILCFTTPKTVVEATQVPAV